MLSECFLCKISSVTTAPIYFHVLCLPPKEKPKYILSSLFIPEEIIFLFSNMFKPVWENPMTVFFIRNWRQMRGTCGWWAPWHTCTQPSGWHCQVVDLLAMTNTDCFQEGVWFLKSKSCKQQKWKSAARQGRGSAGGGYSINVVAHTY